VSFGAAGGFFLIPLFGCVCVCLCFPTRLRVKLTIIDLSSCFSEWLSLWHRGVGGVRWVQDAEQCPDETKWRVDGVCARFPPLIMWSVE